MNQKMKVRSIVILIAVVLLLTLVDQGIKAWALSSLQNGSIEVIPGVFRFTYVENRGAAFGILQGHTLLLALVSAVILLALLYVFSTMPRVKGYGWACVSLAMIISGAVGNLIDRFFRSFVVDLFDFCLINFPVFNFADICVVCGTGLLILLMFTRKELFDDLMESKKDRENRKVSSAQDEVKKEGESHE